MSLMPRSRLITDSHRSPRVAITAAISPGADAHPPVAVEEADHEGDAGRHREDRRAGEPLPGLLGRDHRRHRVATEQDAAE